MELIEGKIYFVHWRFRYRVTKRWGARIFDEVGSPYNRGGVTFAWRRLPDALEIGWAVCSMEENFSRKDGRDKAVERLTIEGVGHKGKVRFAIDCMDDLDKILSDQMSRVTMKAMRVSYRSRIAKRMRRDHNLTFCKNGGRWSKLALEGAFPVHCDKCRGELREIRGRYPGDPPRIICPTCIQDQLDDAAEKHYTQQVKS